MKNILIMLTLLTHISYGQTIDNHETSKNGSHSDSTWKTLVLKKHSIQYPSSWESRLDGPMGIVFLLFSPLESTKDKFRESVNLSVQDLTGQNVDLNKYVAISKDEIKKMLPNVTWIESKRIKSNSDNYHKIVYTGDQVGLHLEFEQYFWIVDSKAHILTFTCEKDKFDNFKKIVEKILNTFIFLK